MSTFARKQRLKWKIVQNTRHSKDKSFGQQDWSRLASLRMATNEKFVIFTIHHLGSHLDVKSSILEADLKAGFKHMLFHGVSSKFTIVSFLVG